MSDYNNAMQEINDMANGMLISWEDAVIAASILQYEIGCHECAWGKVAGCWKCSSK